MNAWFLLSLAIVFEIIGTTTLKLSDGFTKLIPSTIVVIAYIAACLFMAQAVKTLPVGIVYAIWSGVGIVAIALIGQLWFKQTLDFGAITGMALIIAGIVVMNVFSNSAGH
jgi:small multidrug resistance pump